MFSASVVVKICLVYCGLPRKIPGQSRRDSWGGTCQLLAAILNFAAIAQQDGVPTCSQ